MRNYSFFSQINANALLYLFDELFGVVRDDFCIELVGTVEDTFALEECQS